MNYNDVVKAWWSTQLDQLGEGRVWSELNDRDRIEFALNLAGTVEKQETSTQKFNCWSSDEGDSWFDHPADAQLLEDVGAEKVGDEFEVLAGWCCVTARYKVIKAPDDLNDEFEVECISHHEENKPPATVEKQEPEPVAWNYELEEKAFKRLISGGITSDTPLYTAPQPCPECEKLKAEGMVLVTKEDAENYCRILTLLGMEEEGSPIEEVERLLHLREGMVCADCQDTGWLENRVEGKYPCTCMTEAEPYQLLKAERDDLAAQVEKMCMAIEGMLTAPNDDSVASTTKRILVFSAGSQAIEWYQRGAKR